MSEKFIPANVWRAWLLRDVAPRLIAWAFVVALFINGPTWFAWTLASVIVATDALIVMSRELLDRVDRHHADARGLWE